MEVLISWMVVNWVNVLVCVTFIVGCFIALKNGYKQNVSLACLLLVNKAEEKFGAGTGEIKYQFVEEHLYKMLPSIVKFFFSADEIDNAIEKAVDELQEFLEEQSK